VRVRLWQPDEARAHLERCEGLPGTQGVDPYRHKSAFAVAHFRHEAEATSMVESPRRLRKSANSEGKQQPAARQAGMEALRLLQAEFGLSAELPLKFEELNVLWHCLADPRTSPGAGRARHRERGKTSLSSMVSEPDSMDTEMLAA
jgi:hypothetical protein